MPRERCPEDNSANGGSSAFDLAVVEFLEAARVPRAGSREEARAGPSPSRSTASPGAPVAPVHVDDEVAVPPREDRRGLDADGERLRPIPSNALAAEIAPYAAAAGGPEVLDPPLAAPSIGAWPSPGRRAK